MEKFTDEQMALGIKIQTIGEEVGHIEKDGFNKFHKYDYASEKAIKEAIYPALRRQNVLFLLSPGEVREVEGAIILKCGWRFVDLQNGAIISGETYGSGRAGDDKGIYIAITGAIKYVLTTILGIVTGDDPEADRKVARTESRAKASKPSEAPPAAHQEEQGPPPDQPGTPTGTQQLKCGTCESVFPFSDVKARFDAKWPDKEGRWDKGEALFYCPKCTEKTLDSLENAARRAQ